MTKILSFDRTGLAVALLALAVVNSGCSKDGDDAATKGESQAPNEAATEAEPEPEPVAPEPSEPEPVELVEHDLSPADPSWAGWVAKGPASAKVMAHGVKAARIASDGRQGSEDLSERFDLSWTRGKKDFAPYKASLEKGEEASEGKMKLTFTTEEPGLLEWTQEGYGSTSQSFMMHMSVDGEDFTCSNNAMVGIQVPARLAQHKAACKSLAKKE